MMWTREIATCGQMSLKEMVLPCLLGFQQPCESLGRLCQMTVKKREKGVIVLLPELKSIKQPGNDGYLLLITPSGLLRRLLCVAGK